MEKIHQDKINPFCIYRVEKDQPFPVITSGMTEVGINIAYVKPDGSLSDRPSFCLVMQDRKRNVFYSQITYDTLIPLFKEAFRMITENKRSGK